MDVSDLRLSFDESRRRTTPNDVGVGIDFGTTNSAAAIFDGERLTVVPLERVSTIMPSASYIDTEFAVFTGHEAIARYVDSNRGRRVEFRAEVLGEGRSSTGQIDGETGLPSTADTAMIYGQEVEDAGMPGRLFHGIKRMLGSADNARVMIFGKPFRLVALITPILLRIRTTVAAALGARSASHACIGFPVRFEGADHENDRRALQRLGESYAHAGVSEQSFCPEPIAAAIEHLHAHPQAGDRRALAVDFGGGTLDLCIIRCRGESLEVEAVHGVGLGGNRIDQAVFRALLFPLLGEGQTWKRVVEGREVETIFPFWQYEERLLNWQVTYTLNQNRYTTPLLDQLGKGPEAKPFERLYHLIAQNLGFEIFRAIRALKETLSTDTVAVLDIPEIDVHVELTRAGFEAMIADEIALFERTVGETLAQARLEGGDIDLVLRTGGSLLIPAFRRILEDRFPGRLVEQDPFTSVAAGLAIADYFLIGSKIQVGGKGVAKSAGR